MILRFRKEIISTRSCSQVWWTCNVGFSFVFRDCLGYTRTGFELQILLPLCLPSAGVPDMQDDVWLVCQVLKHERDHSYLYLAGTTQGSQN